MAVMRAALGPAFRRIVGNALHHEQRAEVGVAQAERAEVVRLLRDRLRSGTGPCRRRFRGSASRSRLAWRKDVDVEAARCLRRRT